MAEAERTTDHEKIKAWARERGGEPAAVADTLNDDQDGAVLRIRFQDEEGDLSPIFWDRFFEIFEANKLCALMQDKTEDGSTSRFIKFVNR